MRINHNIAAMNTYNKLTANNAATAKSLEKLSSGLKINRAGDNAAGLAISEKMRGQIRGLDQASTNAQDGISLLQTAEGALNETHSILQRMRELAVQSASDTNTNTDRVAIQKEVDELVSEIDRIANTTEFNTQKLINGGLGSTVGSVGTGLTAAAGISNVTSVGATAATYTMAYDATTHAMTLTNGTTSASQVIDLDNGGGVPTGFNTRELSFGEMGLKVTVNASLTADIAANNTFAVSTGSVTLQIGANAGQTLGISISDMRAAALGVNALDVNDQAAASTAITTIDNAIGTVSTQRSALGAYQNRLEHTTNNLSTSSENLSAAESRIRDVDMAKEMMEFQKYNILNQASTAMLAQANQQPQGVLQLLQ